MLSLFCSLKFEPLVSASLASSVTKSSDQTHPCFISLLGPFFGIETDSLTTQALGESTSGGPRVLVLPEVNDEMVLQDAWKQISSEGAEATRILLSFRSQEVSIGNPSCQVWGGGVLCFSRNRVQEELF